MDRREKILKYFFLSNQWLSGSIIDGGCDRLGRIVESDGISYGKRLDYLPTGPNCLHGRRPVSTTLSKIDSIGAKVVTQGSGLQRKGSDYSVGWSLSTRRVN
ncbi:hypothetical protein T4E_4007 [Trichinella pseudospiralis]|uniref:Uncharacterized protein n=1 Tax=Trichinella pseudospiralis TaxID=6337 RepID=A0A0V0Y9H4_TRIPS|nr:hypothetical protein T4E_4007 [Trichinella pseudospiralis]